MYSGDGKSTRHPFYVTQRWKRMRLAYLNANPLCACGCGYAAVEVDHIKPHRGDPVLMFDWHNLQGMTKACHSRKTAREINAASTGYGCVKPNTDAVEDRAPTNIL